MPAHDLFGPLITGRSNAQAKLLRASLSGKASRPGDLLGIEGENLLREARRSGLELEALFVREGSEFRAEEHMAEGLRAQKVFLLSRDVFDSAVSTEAPQGMAGTWIIAECPQPQTADLSLLLEDVQDPGNVGTLIRSAEAFGASQVYLTPASANPWNPKTVRASAGSVFRLPARKMGLHDMVSQLRAAGTRLYAAVADPSARPPHEVDFVRPCAVLIGSEGNGLSPEALALTDERVSIPCKVESLNAAVAGSVLLYEAMRQRGPRP